MIALAVRATFILLAAAGVSWTLRRGSAQSRHVLWTSTFALLLVLPAASTWMPSWEIAVLPTLDSTVSVDPVDARDQNSLYTTVAQPPLAEGSVAGATSIAVPSVATGRQGSRVSWQTDVADVAGIASEADITPATAFWMLWALGVLASLASIAMGHVRFGRLVRTGRPVPDPTWARDLSTLRRLTGVQRDVALVLNARAATPMTGGIRRPVILLPNGAESWTAERRRVVLMHELIHVRRHDALRQLVAKASLAIYWFHPLGWFASRQAAVSRELACDEEVLALGTRPSEYASLLLDLAGGADDRSPAVLSLAMIQRSQLERRLMSILDPRRPQRSALATTCALLTLAVFGISAAIAQPVPSVIQASPPEPPLEPLATLPPPPVTPAVAELPPLAEALTTPPEVAEPSPATGIPGRPLPASPVLAPESMPPTLPMLRPVPVTGAEPQEPSCRMEGQRGSFSGTMSSSGSRTEMSGTHNGDRVIQKYIDGLRLCMRVRGDVEMSDDDSAIRSINGTDSWVVLESEEDDLHRLVITGGPSGLAYQWSVDGRDQPYDADASEWQDRMFTILSGYSQAARLRGQQASLRGQIASHRGEVASMRGQIASHRGEVASIQGQIASERGQVANMRGQVAGQQGRIAGLQAQRQNASNDQTRQRIDEDIAQIRAQIAEIEEQIALSETNARISALEAEIDEYDVDERTRQIEAELDAFDLDSKVRQVEREIEELDADRRAEAIEAELESEVAALRRLLARL